MSVAGFFFCLRWMQLGLIATAMLFSTAATHGVILFRTGDPTANTTEPTGELAGSGWQYQGLYGDLLGTAIAPHFFITARHLAGASDKFIFHGKTYPIVRSFDDPVSDLRISEVSGTLPLYAPLYNASDEIGKRFVVIGRGTRRGPDRIVNGEHRGWNWGATDKVQRWGENQAATATARQLYALFDQGGLANEAHISGGDSGGGVFLNQGGVWKLAGIVSDVDRFASGPDGGGPYEAAMFDMRGSYKPNGTLIIGAAPIPSGSYIARISSRLGWISSIVGPRVLNLSARVTVGIGDEVSIGGFIIKGDPVQAKRVMVRGLGPSLKVGSVALPGRIADTFLELYDGAGVPIFYNDDWRGWQAIEIQNTGLAPVNEKESAFIAILPSGNYTAVLRGVDGNTGIGLIEVYDLDGIGETRLLNLSTRAFVGSDDRALIGGLIVTGASARLLLRAIGPELKTQGVMGKLENPTLELHDTNGQLIAANDNWRDAPNSFEVDATGLAPLADAESAILATAESGLYTAVVRGVDNSTGVALLEAYLLN